MVRCSNASELIIHSVVIKIYFRSDAGKAELDAQLLKEKERIQSLTQGERITDWAKRHQYGLIGGSWAVSMGIASAIVMRNRYVLAMCALLNL